ncbi:hypothetical protein N0V88_002802 [Collariella sp. IMI 366227]|nr:hypothetical protein N0V88_002802 [Collariella sp. IMI 366227]
MQKTKVLGALRGIFPPIHQPLPLDRTESIRLLESFKSSFRDQLDQEYGATSLAKPPMALLPSKTAQPTTPQPAVEHGSARATDRHLHAILHNPLFGSVGSNKAGDGFQKPWDTHKLVFEKAASRGLMTLKRAHGFLALVKSEAMPSIKSSPVDYLKPTGAGLLVIQWLRSSGLERDLTFVNHVFFMQILLQFAVAEGLDHIVWGWITQLMEKDRSSIEPNLRAISFGRLVEHLVKAKSFLVEPDASYAALLQAQAMARNHKPLLAALKPAWDDTAWCTTKRWRGTPSVDVFDAFEAMGSAIHANRRERAHVKLYHPVNPSPDLALSYFSREEFWELAHLKDGLGKDHGPAKSHLLSRVAALGVDTVQHLVQAKETQEALRIWGLMQKHIAWFDRPVAVV